MEKVCNIENRRCALCDDDFSTTSPMMRKNKRTGAFCYYLCPGCMSKAKNMLKDCLPLTSFELRYLILSDKKNNVTFKFKCNTCDKLYCVTNSDINQNHNYMRIAKQQKSASIADIFTKNATGYEHSIDRLHQYANMIVDYSRCPSCHSNDVGMLTNKEYKELTEENTNDNKNLSVADELLKLKNLLDMDAITKDEYDYAKKELLRKL